MDRAVACGSLLQPARLACVQRRYWLCLGTVKLGLHGAAVVTSISEMVRLEDEAADARRVTLFAPLTRGILGATLHGGKVAGGAGYGPYTGPREVVLGRNGHQVGVRRGRTGSA